MEIKTEVENELKELNEEQQERFAKRIADNFSKWDEDRVSQVTTAKDIMKEVYLDQNSRNKDGK
jgi:CRISPR/Cas system type I-B associated protein Csh2 (Cas7 group RAMP superfamily)